MGNPRGKSSRKSNGRSGHEIPTDSMIPSIQASFMRPKKKFKVLTTEWTLCCKRSL